MYNRLDISASQSQGVLTVRDRTDHAAIGLPEVTAGIIRVIDYAGVEVYKNTGWDADDFSAPDLSYPSAPSTDVNLLTEGDAFRIGDISIQVKLNG